MAKSSVFVTGLKNGEQMENSSSTKTSEMVNSYTEVLFSKSSFMKILSIPFLENIGHMNHLQV